MELGKVWPWVAFVALVLGLLGLDLGVFHRKPRAIHTREAVLWSVFWVCLSLIFNAVITVWKGPTAGLEFLTGYLIEKSLSVDNIFVFVLIFTYFRVPEEYQHRVLFWGIVGALIMRALLIGTGAVLLARFHWVEYIFGAFLVIAGIRMARHGEPEIHPEGNRAVRLFRRLFPVASEYHGQRFFIRGAGGVMATPLFVVLILVETTDVVFAFDSIPAIFAVTRDPFIVFTSNIFAILGLRALYFLMASVMGMFEYLNLGLALVLVFVGGKMLLSSHFEISIGVSLAVVFGILLLAVVASLVKRAAPGRRSMKVSRDDPMSSSESPRPLPKLRVNLDFMPSPLPDRPGLMIRDPYQYSDTTAIIPPLLVETLQCFDGQKSELDLKAHLYRATGQLDVSNLSKNLLETLSQAGFLEDDTYLALRDRRHREFAAATDRLPLHAGSAYPEDSASLRKTLGGYIDAADRPGEPNAVRSAIGGAARSGSVIGVAAPHVSPEGGWRAYGAAYRALPAAGEETTFVILGTSHYGPPERFGLTRKRFRTPLGIATTATDLVDHLEKAAGDVILMEDYCHSIEHSIEFQVIFLQHLVGPGVRVLPVLCGAFAQSLTTGRPPEDNPGLARFFDALGNLAARKGQTLAWILGIDLAHVGRRYGDPFAVTAGEARMKAVALKDHQRIERILSGDSGGFWELVRRDEDELRWCGSAPLYTFLKAVSGVRGELLHYQQWNIDERSVVSFAGLTFRA